MTRQSARLTPAEIIVILSAMTYVENAEPAQNLGRIFFRTKRALEENLRLIDHKLYAAWKATTLPGNYLEWN